MLIEANGVLMMVVVVFWMIVVSTVAAGLELAEVLDKSRSGLQVILRLPWWRFLIISENVVNSMRISEQNMGRWGLG